MTHFMIYQPSAQGTSDLNGKVTLLVVTTFLCCTVTK